ncbi:Hypothetical predicted protein [Octopus vulgaris]|uniref:Uncharacterized protein n=1 Tax=Octopus vulgaris TaxID=6645 RepID=A0AA36AMM4_OCTVU|nr:Hypothetical predicted protein [Octopus vulgaris]
METMDGKNGDGDKNGGGNGKESDDDDKNGKLKEDNEDGYNDGNGSIIEEKGWEYSRNFYDKVQCESRNGFRLLIPRPLAQIETEKTKPDDDGDDDNEEEIE